jgi:hypothetical protein
VRHIETGTDQEDPVDNFVKNVERRQFAEFHSEIPSFPLPLDKCFRPRISPAFRVQLVPVRLIKEINMS